MFETNRTEMVSLAIIRWCERKYSTFYVLTFHCHLQHQTVKLEHFQPIETVENTASSLDNEIDLETGDDESLRFSLVIPSSTTHRSSNIIAPNSCAICLEPYREGEVIVWSRHKDCPHVYHRQCCVDYLLSLKVEGKPCPTCRQEYCLASDDKETKK